MSIEISASKLADSVTLTFPDIAEHKYLAGALDPMLLQPSDSLSPLKPSFHYTLSGVTPNRNQVTVTPPDVNFFPDSQTAPITVDTGSRRTFILPRPNSITSLRWKCRSDNKRFLEKAPSGDSNAKIVMLSTVHLLTYDISTGPVVTDQTGAQLPWNQQESVLGSGFINLHIFAEPDAGVDGTHAVAAFDSLMQILVQNSSSLSGTYVFRSFDNRTKMIECHADGNYPGILKAVDLRNLPELKLNSGGEVANCVGGIIPQP
jgi:hypothetical protein